MRAYDSILILFSFVYATAITHVLSTTGEIIIASKRIRFSWFNAGWMLVVLLFTCAWWIGQIGGWIWYFAVLQTARSERSLW